MNRDETIDRLRFAQIFFPLPQFIQLSHSLIPAEEAERDAAAYGLFTATPSSESGVGGEKEEL